MVTPSTANNTTGTILLIEDDEGVREFVRLSLEHAGYTVFAASESDQALDLFCSNPAGIDLVLTDVVMPVRNGPELVAEFRRVRPNVRVVFMSGYTGGFGTNPIELPHDIPLLEKPFTLNCLLQVVARAIGRAV